MSGSPFAHSALRSTQGRAVWVARFRRRTRVLASLALAILCWREGFRALGPAAWSFVGGLLWLAPQFPAHDGLALPSLALFACLCVASLIDARYFILADGPLVVLLLSGVAMRALSPDGDLFSSLAAAAFGFAMFRAVAWTFEKLRGVPGLGQGDARLFAIAGLWLGWAGLPSCLLIATLSAALAAVIALRDGALATLRDPLPFGPHLALGFWAVWVFGPLAI